MSKRLSENQLRRFYLTEKEEYRKEKRSLFYAGIILIALGAILFGSNLAYWHSIGFFFVSLVIALVGALWSSISRIKEEEIKEEIEVNDFK